MKEYTKRDSCMTMEEVIERNTGMSLKAFLTPQPNPYIHNMDRAVEFFKKKVNDAAEEKEILQIKIVGDYDADGMNASAILYIICRFMDRCLRRQITPTLRFLVCKMNF